MWLSRHNRERHRELIPYVIATIAVVQMFFLSIMIVNKDPFATYLTQTPVDGRGLNPLLQNPYMVIHPPSLYTGLVGMTIPFRVRDGGADHGVPGRLVAAGGSAVDDVLVVLPVPRG